MNTLVGNSAWAREMRRAIERVSGFGSTVLIVGPSGTGKELVAAGIHQRSLRAGKPFVAVDCASIPPTLFASQLFGHVKGAFSGAGCDTLGSFRAADGGTVFLDEIGELSPELQVQLLRVIQQRTVVPLGSHRGIPVDVRIIAATCRELEEEVAAGRFRLDLYYRLNVLKLRTTPLCDRREDIDPLCRLFLDRLSIENGLPRKRLAPSAIRVLRSYDWPGNVRQLQNSLERLVVFSEAAEIGGEEVLEVLEAEPVCPLADHAAEASCPYTRQGPSPGFQGILSSSPTRSGLGPWPTLAEFEGRFLEETLEQTFFNQTAAARLLGIDRRLLARKIRKYGIVLRASVKLARSA